MLCGSDLSTFLSEFPMMIDFFDFFIHFLSTEKYKQNNF